MSDVEPGTPDDPIPTTDDFSVATLDDLQQIELPERSLLVATPRGRRIIQLKAINDYEYDALLLQHPPREEDRDALGFLKRWHPATWEPALTAACMVNPKVTSEQLEDLWRTWSRGNINLLYGTSFELCEQVLALEPLPKDFVVTRGSPPNSDSA